MTHIALAFEVPGRWHNEKEAVIWTVRQMLMGGGGSSSAGGPGKGMHSRLYCHRCALTNIPDAPSASALKTSVPCLKDICPTSNSHQEKQELGLVQPSQHVGA